MKSRATKRSRFKGVVIATFRLLVVLALCHYAVLLVRSQARRVEGKRRAGGAAQQACESFGVPPAGRPAAGYWQRRALDPCASPSRDAALISWLRAVQANDTVDGRRQAAELVGADWRHLVATFRHRQGVWAVAFSPDGERVVTGSRDGSARVWSVRNADPVSPELRHEAAVLVLAFSPDGRQLVTGSKDGTARLWSARKGEPLGAPLRHESAVLAVAFSPDGQRVVTGSQDGAARVWSAQNGEPLGPPVRHEGAVRAVAFGPEGRRVVSGSDDGTARVWSANDGEPVSPPLRHESWISDVAFSPDGQSVAVASADGTLRLWSVNDGKASPLSCPGLLTSMTFSPDGRWLATARLRLDIPSDDESPGTGLSGTVTVWSVRDGTVVGPPLRHESSVEGLRFAPDGRTLTTATPMWLRRFHAVDGSWRVQSRRLIVERLSPAHVATIQGELSWLDDLEGPAIAGDPASLRSAWEHRLGLRLDDRTRIVSRWADER